MNTVSNIKNLTANYKSAHRGQNKKCCLLSPDLVSGLVPVNKFVSLQFIFRHMRIMPSIEEVLIKRVIKAARAPFVLEDIFGQLLDINTWVIMTEEDIVTEDGQFHKGDFTIKFEANVLLNFPETLEE